ncbi:metal-dependent hydrolase family protein [Desulfospira joergensenii]|uniref:metal-dependent hydrolase family protein n=1 Tax=Desulfospira joergensenii TaxID=53329 RepID=UPI0003B59E71|nr:amidohydrolase family protein [Desulfospira joergensenii]
MATAFVDGRLFLGNGKVLEQGSVVVDKDRIISVHSSREDLPGDIQRISLKDHTLFPGFIDCHVHLVMDASPDPLHSLAQEPIALTAIKAAENARKTLAAGVTTIRDMGGVGGVDFTVRQAAASGLINGPRVLASGSLVCMTGGHGWPIGREADGPDDVRRAVREQVKAGADQIKLMATGGVLTSAVSPGSAQLTREEMKAGIEEAHKAEKKTATHAMGSEGILNALRAGIDSIEHGVYLNDEIISLMKENQVFFVPTVAALYHIGRMGVEAGIPDWAVKKNNTVIPHHRESVKKALEAGVDIAMGTDAGTPFNFHGKNLMEIPLLVSRGLSPNQALVAATGTAARLLGLEHEIGTIEPGKAADLVMVRGNPLEDIDILNRADAVTRVMKQGKFLGE